MISTEIRDAADALRCDHSDLLAILDGMHYRQLDSKGRILWLALDAVASHMGSNLEELEAIVKACETQKEVLK